MEVNEGWAEQSSTHGAEWGRLKREECKVRQNKWKNRAVWTWSDLEKQSNAQGQSKWGTGGAEWVRGKKSRAEWKQEESGFSAEQSKCCSGEWAPSRR